MTAAGGAVPEDEAIAFATVRGRWVLVAMILGSGIAGLDATVVNVALPAIGRDFDAAVAGLQWTLNGYLLTLASLILLGGSLGDHLGRRRVFLVGVVWFAVASLLCGVAPNTEALVAARALQGVGGALLTPGSLAILQASFAPEDRARAIGAWSAFAGIATALGPFVGGYLVDAVSWRWIFLLNLPLAAVVVVLSVRHVPETRDPTAPPGIDVAGATLGALALGGVTYFLIEVPERGASGPILLAGILGVAGAIGFVATERRSRHPLLPLDIFASRQFTGANVTTFSVYAALGGMFFLLGTYLQTALGYSPVEAGVALFPVTVLMLLLSERAGALATRIGPRRPMTFGPLVVAVALLLMARIEPGTSYVTTVLPAAVVFGLGLSLTVAPLTATVLAAADVRHSGVASGVNNAVARAAQLLAVAVLPAAAGITGDDYRDPATFADGFRTAAIITATLSVLGGLTSWLAISDDVLATPEEEAAVAAGRVGTAGHFHCGADAPPLRRDHRRAA